MVNPEKSFDVIVMGGELRGLISAALLVKGKKNVLVLKEKGYRPFYERDGYRFVPFSTFSEETIRADLFKNLSVLSGGETYRKRKRPSKRTVTFQVILPEARIDLYRDRSLLRREWEREFPGETDHIEAFYQELERLKKTFEKESTEGRLMVPSPYPRRSFLKRWFSFDGLPKGGTADRLSTFSREFKTFIELQMLSRSHLHLDSYPIPLVAHLILDDDTTSREWIDRDRLEPDLLETILLNGGIVKEIEAIDRVEVEWRGGVRVFLRGEAIPLRCQCLVINVPIHSVSNLFEKRRGGLSKWGKRLRPSYGVIPFCVGLRQKAIPVGMGNRLVSLLDLNHSFGGGNLLFLHMSGRDGESQAPEGKIALTVEALMPYEEIHKEGFSELESGVIDHLKSLFPFFEDHMEFIDDRWAEEHWRSWSYPHHFYKIESGYPWGREPTPLKLSRNLYATGKEIDPHPNLDGEVVSGLQLGEEILRKLG